MRWFVFVPVVLALCVVCMAAGQSKPGSVVEMLQQKKAAARAAREAQSRTRTIRTSKQAMKINPPVPGPFATPLQDPTPSSTPTPTPTSVTSTASEQLGRQRRDTTAPNITTGIVNFNNSENAYLTVRWVGQGDLTMFAIIIEEDIFDYSVQNVLVSHDYGSTYATATSITESVVAIEISAMTSTNSYYVYALPRNTASNVFYVSRNNGTSFTAFNSPAHFTDILVNPSDADEFLALTPSQNTVVDTSDVYHCSLKNAPNYCQKPIPHVYEVEWCTVSSDCSSQIFSTRFYNAPTNLDALPSIRFFKGNNVPIDANSFWFEQVDDILFVSDIPDENKFQEKALHVSIDAGDTFQDADFPIKGYANNYKPIDGSERLAIVGMQHTKVESLVTNTIIALSGGKNSTFQATHAKFTPDIEGSVSDPLRVHVPSQNDGCNVTVSIPGFGSVFMVQRGTCTFITKVRNAQSVGASAIVIINTDDSLLEMIADVLPGEDYPIIPAFLISKSSGNAILSAYQSDSNFRIVLAQSAATETESFQSSNIFVSDDAGATYSLSLADAMYTPPFRGADGEYYEEVIDIHKVASQNATYIANYVNKENLVVSAITFTKGAVWQTITPPSTCHGSSCRLHIGMESSQQYNSLPLPVSASQAAGLVYANGYIGDSVGLRAEDAVPVYSTDGGCSWSILPSLVGPQSFYILDHGSVILAVSALGKTNNCSYSLDYGATFTLLNFATDPQLVDGVITEPDGTSDVAFIFYEDNKSGALIAAKLDFSAVLTRDCTGNDYQPVAVHRMCANTGCLEGRHVSYQRRIPSMHCRNGQDFEADVIVGSKCDCVASDYQCAYGFWRGNVTDSNLDIPCVPDPELGVPICAFNTTFEMDAPYSRTSGDDCLEKSSVFIQKQRFSCRQSKAPAQSTAGHTSSGTIATVVILSLLVAGAMVFAIVLYISEQARNRVIRGLGVGDSGTGRLGKVLAACSCFRKQKTFQYSRLNEEVQDGELESDDDDELLFGVDDARPV